MNEKDKAQLELLKARLETEGVATVQVKDGRMFFFNKDKLLQLLEIAEKDPDGLAAIMIQTERKTEFN